MGKPMTSWVRSLKAFGRQHQHGVFVFHLRADFGD